MASIVSRILRLKRTVNPSSINETPGGPEVKTGARATGDDYSRQIVVGIKGYDESLVAKDWALQHVCRPGDTLCLVHVIEEQAPSGCRLCGTNSGPEPREDEDRTEVEEMMKRFARGAYMAYMVHAEVVVREGHVGRTILEEAANRKAAVLVLGSCGEDCKSRSKHSGSKSGVNAFCQRRARCPVILVEQRHQRCGTRQAGLRKVLPGGLTRSCHDSARRKPSDLNGPLRLSPFQRAELMRLQQHVGGLSRRDCGLVGLECKQ